MDNYITTSQFANLIGVHRSTIDRWLKDGKIPFITTAGGHRRIALEIATKLVNQLAHGNDGKYMVHLVKSVRFMNPPRRTSISIEFNGSFLRIEALTNEEQAILSLKWPPKPIITGKINGVAVSEVYILDINWFKIKQLISKILERRFPTKLTGFVTPSEEDHANSSMWVAGIQLANFKTNISVPPFDFSYLNKAEQEEIMRLLPHHVVKYNSQDIFKLIDREIKTRRREDLSSD